MSTPRILQVTDTSQLALELQSAHGLAPLTWDELDLNRQGSSLTDWQMLMKGVPQPHVGFEWERGDGATPDWYPQGITGLRKGDARKFVVVSWYSKHEPNRGVRLSFVDVTGLRASPGVAVPYRHVLLVVPDPSGKVFGPIDIHAGGLASRGNLLYVADTQVGFRVFDTTKIFRAEADHGKSRCGIVDGRAYAFDYRYVLPQTTLYSMTMGGQNFSYASMDWSDPTAPVLVTGNYHKPPRYDNPPAQVSWWPMSGSEIASFRDLIVTDQLRTQGAAAHGGCLWLSRSGSKPELAVARFAQGAIVGSWKRYAWPHGCEDLHRSPHSHNLWCLTEHPDSRFVFAVDPSRYAP